MAETESNPAIAPSPASPVVSLPDVAKTRDDQDFTPSAGVWRLNKRADGGGALVFDWSTVRMGATSLQLSKLILASTAGAAATMSTHNTFKSLALLTTWFASQYPDAPEFEWTAMTADVGRAFLDYGLTTGEKGNHLSRVRTHYRYGVESLRRPEFDSAVLVALESLRAPGNAKGSPVRSADPDEGDLTAPEIDSILAAIASGRGDPYDRALVWLALNVGRRPLQYTLMRNKDLLRYNTVQSDGRPTRLYQVRFRRTKKRTVTDSTMVMPIPTDLGDELWQLKRGDDEAPLLYWIQGEHPEAALNYRMKRWAKVNDLTTHRHQPGDAEAAGQPRPLNLYPYRFRYTIATNAHEEGASRERIGILLDQEDLQNTEVYTANSAVAVLRIQDKVNAIYDPMVQRFKGQWTASTAPTAPDGDPIRMIPGFAPQIQLDVGGIGHCGAKSLCNLAPPLTCYACDRFVAFTDGPHRDVVARMEAMMDGADARIALQLAPALAAAREVVAFLDGGHQQ